jgi:hypothetical protein
LGQEHAVNRVQVFPFCDGGRYYQYRVDASPDGASWSQVVDASANTTLLMLKNSANPGVHVNEFLVFAAGAAPSDKD